MLLKILCILVKIDRNSNILTNHEIYEEGKPIPVIGFVPSNLLVRKMREAKIYGK